MAIEIVDLPMNSMGKNTAIVMFTFTRPGNHPINPVKPSFSYGFSYGFPMVFLWFSRFPMVFLWVLQPASHDLHHTASWLSSGLDHSLRRGQRGWEGIWWDPWGRFFLMHSSMSSHPVSSNLGFPKGKTIEKCWLFMGFFVGFTRNGFIKQYQTWQGEIENQRKRMV